MKNYVQSGNVLTLPAPAAVEAGDVVIVGELVGFAATDADIGKEVEVEMRGVFSVLKKTGEAVTPGAPIYWDADAKRATITEATNHRLGTATRAVTADVLRVDVRLAG